MKTRSRAVLDSAVVITLLAIAATRVEAQGVLDRLRDAARKVNEATINAELLSAKSLDLEPRNLTVPVGTVAFGVGAVDVKDGVALRVRAYYYNAGDQAVTLPVPADGFFVLVDTKGRRLSPIGNPSIRGLKPGTATISIPGLERVGVDLMFAAPVAGETEALLKVGTFGVIRGIPVHSGAFATSAPVATWSAHAVPAPGDAPPAPSLATGRWVGPWVRSGNSSLRSSIVALPDGRLSFTNEAGNSARGHLESWTLAIVDEWEGGLRATMSPDGNRIDFANTTYWARSGATPLPAALAPVIPSQGGTPSPTVPAVPPPSGTLEGNWQWQCCAGNPRSGTLKITSQAGDGSFIGDMYDASNGAYDSRLQGRIQGNQVVFDRTGSWGTQRWTGTITRDAYGISGVQGSWSGYSEGSFQDRSFTVSRSSQGATPLPTVPAAPAPASPAPLVLPPDATRAEVAQVVVAIPQSDVTISVRPTTVLPPTHKIPVGNPDVLLVPMGAPLEITTSREIRYSSPVTVTMPYRKALLPPGVDPRRIQVAARHTESGKTTWELLPTLSVDTVAGTAQFQVVHFSEFEPVAEEKAVEIPGWAVKKALKIIGGEISGDAVAASGLIDDFLLAPLLSYATTKDDGRAIDLAIWKFVSRGAKLVFPEVSLTILGGEAFVETVPVVVEAMIASGQAQQYEASVFGTSSAGFLAGINNLFANVPFFRSGPVVNRGITPENFGTTLKSEADLRALWFERFRDDLLQGPLGVGPTARDRIEQQLRDAYPTILKYWKVKRAPVVLRELHDRIFFELLDAANKLRERKEALAQNVAEEGLGRDTRGAYRLKEVRIEKCGPTGARMPTGTEVDCNIYPDASRIVGNYAARPDPSVPPNVYLWAMNLNTPPKDIAPGRTFTIAPSGESDAVQVYKSSSASRYGLGLTATGNSYAWVGFSSTRSTESKPIFIDNTSFKFTAPDDGRALWEPKLTMVVGNEANFMGLIQNFAAKGTITYVYEKDDPTTCPTGGWERVTGVGGELRDPPSAPAGKQPFALRGNNVVITDISTGKNNIVIFEAPPKCLVWNESYPLRFSVTQLNGGPEVSAVLVVQGHVSEGTFSSAAGEGTSQKAQSTRGAKDAVSTMYKFDAGLTPFEVSQPPTGEMRYLVQIGITGMLPDYQGNELRWRYVRGGKK